MPLPVWVAVTAVNDAPPLTAMGSTGGRLNASAQGTRTLADRTAQGNEADVDGTVDAFVVKAVSSGTLLIGTSAGTATRSEERRGEKEDATHVAPYTDTKDASVTLTAFQEVAK